MDISAARGDADFSVSITSVVLLTVTFLDIQIVK